MKSLRYKGEALIFLLFMGLFRLMPIRAASYCGGRLGRVLCFFIGKKSVVKRNLDLIMPDLSSRDAKRLLYEIWENGGRNIGELPHLPRIYQQAAHCFTLKGVEHAHAAMAQGRGVIFIAGHFSNVHVVQMGLKHLLGVCGAIYRPANNPYIRAYLDKRYRPFTDYMLRKGREAVAGTLKLLGQKKPVLMLVDQRMNTGVEVTFFGHKVMAPDGAAIFARRCDSPIIPMTSYRAQQDKSHFIIEFFPEMELADAVSDSLQDIYSHLEAQIKLHPEAWYWFHDRWRVK